MNKMIGNSHTQLIDDCGLQKVNLQLAFEGYWLPLTALVNLYKYATRKQSWYKSYIACK